MGEPFKNFIDETLVREAAVHLARTAPGFDAPRFVALATEGLESLELKARAMRLADALEATLPAAFDAAAAAIEAALAPPSQDEELGTMRLSEAGLAGWVLWPMGEYVARRGMAQPERALALLAELTQRFSAEFAIRPFIAAHPALAFETLARWVRHPNLHVRRLASEGSRPRLPWGMRLQALVQDPTPALPLLLALQDDPSPYVRRSVANHLNDIAKDHPALVVGWVEQHLRGASPERRALLKHASRTLVKKGHGPMLKAWGLGQAFKGTAALEITPARVKLGGGVQLVLTLRSAATRPQQLVVDYAVHHVKADGGTSPKVFKGWALQLPAGASVVLNKQHSLRPVTTRRYHPGLHEVVVQVNGKAVAQTAFELRIPKPAEASAA